MIVLIILAYSILGIVTLILLLLFAVLVLPVRCYSRVHIQDEQFKWGWRLTVLSNCLGMVGGLNTPPRLILVGREFRLRSKPKGASPAKATNGETVTPTDIEQGEESNAKSSRGLRKRQFPVAVLWKHQRSILRFVGRLFSALHLQVKGDLTIGVENPAVVGMLCGGFWALLSDHAQQLQIRWIYIENVCQGEVILQAHTRPVEILWSVVRLAWELPLIQIWRTIKRR